MGRTPILRDISLSLHPGEYLSIIGPNGAGKSSLIKCLAGLYTHWSGKLHLCGRPFADYSSRERARRVSYVPQAEGRSAPLSVQDFVAMGRYPHLSAFSSLSSADYAAIRSALQQAGLESLRERRLETLSGGERQMAFIAAALAQEAQILLLDEPSTFLDYYHQSQVARLLRSASRDGATLLAVHHDINTAVAASHRIVALKKGAIVFNGTPEEIVQPGVLESLYEISFRRIPAPPSPLPLIIPGGDE